MSSISERLRNIGRLIAVWDAQQRALLVAGAVLGALWLFTLFDILLRFHRAGRVACWLLLLAAAGAAFWWIFQALSQKRSPQAVAARIENTFPELDSHLINYVQFSAQPAGDALTAAYLSAEIPHWSSLDLSHLRNRKMLLRGAAGTGAALVITLISAMWSGPAWGNAALRILNPFSSRVPGTLAQILDVKPGDGHVLRGSPVVLSLRVQGKAGQPVSVEVKAADDKAHVVKLGELRGSGEQEFVHRVPSASADLTYRFYAGDAESEKYTIRALPPLAFRTLQFSVTPPEYTRRLPQSGDALRKVPQVPQGAQITLTISANRPLAETASIIDGQTVRAERSGKGDAEVWKISATVTSAAPWHLVAKDGYGFGAEQDVNFQFLADQPPAVTVVAPTGKVSLPPGGTPRIQWEAVDDYAMDQVILERVVSEEDPSKNLEIKSWKQEKGGAAMAETWTGDTALLESAGREPLLLRLVALDNRRPEANRTVSKVVRFDREGITARTDGDREKARAEVTARIEKLIEMQKANLQKTLDLQKDAAAVPSDAWTATMAAQQAIRDFAMKLLVDPSKPLGPQQAIVQQLHSTWMDQAVRVLMRIPQLPPEQRATPGAEAAQLEERILRALTQLDSSVAKVQQHQSVTGLLALLEALVAGQDLTLRDTRKCAETKAKVGQPLVERQDKLSGDVGAFVTACRKEIQTLQSSDAEFAKLVEEAAGAIESQKIAGTMLKASEQLENNAPEQAMPPETLALAQLKEIQEKFNHWRTEEAKEKELQLQEAVSSAKERLEKLKELQSKVVDAIKQTVQQKDHSEKETDEIEQEIGDIKAAQAETLLDIAKDLHIFPELPVGNDLVADVTQIYEEAKQVPGSESNVATELGLQKEDWILKALEAATERVDDMEMWLMSQPDSIKRLTENFDKQELPDIPVIPMATEMEDIIGDLLQQEEEQKDQADDSATNQGSSDFAAGWGIADGEFVNYSAKGKSGNEAPDHKEQDGRSLVGRQGMADGETAAGSGKINQGDDNITARRTQDSAQSGEVQEEGHAEAKATGGGKSAGYSDTLGMAGTGPRRDTKAGVGGDSMAGLQAMLRRNAEALYAKASMLHVRTGSLDEAVEAMRLAEDALKKGYSIREVREYQRRAIAALKKTQMELSGATGVESIDDGSAPVVQVSEVAGGADEAPARYKDLVSEYYKSLSGGEVK